MMLTKDAHKMLNSLYTHFQETGSLSSTVSYSDTPVEKKAQISLIEQLTTAGMVEILEQSVSWVELKLTAPGVEHFEEPVQCAQSQTFNINISGNVENSIIGNQRNAEIHNEPDIELIKALIEQVASSDREQLSALPDTLAKIQHEGHVKRGVLSKFNSALTKYPKLFDTVGNALLNLALDPPF